MYITFEVKIYIFFKLSNFEFDYKSCVEALVITNDDDTDFFLNLKQKPESHEYFMIKLFLVKRILQWQ